MQVHANTFLPEADKIDCLLISPPHWYPLQPYMALPALQGYLRQQGFTTIIADLNLLTLDYFFKKDTLEALFERTERRLFGALQKPVVPEHKKSFCKIALLADKIINQVESAVDLIRGTGYYDYRLRHEAMKIIYLATKLVSVCYFPTRYTFNSFVMRFNLSNPNELLAALEAVDENPFIEITQALLEQTFLRRHPRTVGINITSGAQVAGGMTIARIVKTLRPNTHVIIGGSYFSRLMDQLRCFPQIFKYVDSVIVYEGEIAMAELLDCVKNEGNLAAVPHHVWQDKASDQVQANLTPAFPDVTQLPVPDYQGMALNLYLVPECILSVFSSRGCYWNQCAFCNHGFCYQNQFRQRPPERVVEDMQALNQQYGSTCFDIVDEAVKPETAETLSRHLLIKNLNFNWMCLARIDDRFSADRLILMRRAGCRFLSFGVESNHDRVLRLMRKGTNAELNLRVLSDAVRAGIWTHIMVIFGFPGETDAQAQATMELITKYHRVFHDSGVSAFQLGRHSHIYNNPEKYGIKPDSDWSKSTDLAYEIILPYRINGQDTIDASKNRVAQFRKLLIEKKGSFERTTSFLYCIRYNTTNFSSHFTVFKKYDMHRQLGELDVLNPNTA